jgi:beta-glucosidase
LKKRGKILFWGSAFLLLLNFASTIYLNITVPNPEWDWSRIDTSRVSFPDKFLWGAATSAYQIEGGLYNNNWYLWERTPQRFGVPRIARDEKCGLAANHYELYKEDVKLMAEFGLNAYRFSIEWSRIEPREGEFDQKAIEHYRDLIRRLKAAKIEPMITLHHFTDPIWFVDLGGWEKEQNLAYWMRYARRMFQEFQSEVTYWSTFNEFNLVPVSGWLEGGFPPGKTDFHLFATVSKHMLMGHVQTYLEFKKLSRTKKHQVGAILAILEARPYNRWFILDWLAAYYEERIWMQAMIEFFATGRYHVKLPFRDSFTYTDTDGIRAMDFFGINYYTRTAVVFNFFSPTFYYRIQLPGFPKTDMGWAIYPEGLYFAVKRYASLGVPIIITESGVADATDTIRARFIQQHLYVLSEILRAGYDVRGFYYWSLLDNFEWLEGFDKRFGLFEVDYKTFKRTLREGSKEYQKIIRRFPGRGGS